MTDMDFALYWFMFPVSICVATTAMLSGIGGAALFTPIFLVVFPLLGPDYVIHSAVAAIGAALLTQTFGFASGLIGYLWKRLIDFRGALPFIAVGVPVAVTGALIAPLVDPTWLKGLYGLLMLALATAMLRRRAVVSKSEADVEPASRPLRTITDRAGISYSFVPPRQGRGALATAAGAFLTGMVSVGIGEVVMPQLVKRNQVPIPVAAATSVLIVIVTAALASMTQISSLIARGGVGAVPWHLVAYTIPGVIVGGQIGPRLQGKVSQRAMEIAIGGLFLVIGLAMLATVIR